MHSNTLGTGFMSNIHVDATEIERKNRKGEHTTHKYTYTHTHTHTTQSSEHLRFCSVHFQNICLSYRRKSNIYSA